MVRNELLERFGYFPPYPCAQNRHKEHHRNSHIHTIEAAQTYTLVDTAQTKNSHTRVLVPKAVEKRLNISITLLQYQHYSPLDGHVILMEVWR